MDFQMRNYTLEGMFTRKFACGGGSHHAGRKPLVPTGLLEPPGRIANGAATCACSCACAEGNLQMSEEDASSARSAPCCSALRVALRAAMRCAASCSAAVRCGRLGALCAACTYWTASSGRTAYPEVIPRVYCVRCCNSRSHNAAHTWPAPCYRSPRALAERAEFT